MLRLLHLSDFHFRAKRRFNFQSYFLEHCVADALPTDRVEKVAAKLGFTRHCSRLSTLLARFVAYEVDEFDFTVISGDLSASGDNADLSLAYAYIFANAGRAADHLDDGGNPTLSRRSDEVLLLPGNHDRYADDLGTPNSRNFDHVFRSSWGQRGPYIQRATLTNSITLEKLILIAGDFCLQSASEAYTPNAFYRFGQGYAYDFIIDLMVQATLLERETDPKTGVIWVSHFPPIRDRRDIISKLHLRNEEAVIKAAQNVSVDYILSGHIHSNDCFDSGGVRILGAGAACTYAERMGNWAHLLSFDVANGVVRLDAKKSWKFDENDAAYAPA